MSRKLSLPATTVKRIVALCYVRQSKTRNDGDADSPERQKDNIQAMCDKKGWIAEWYIDAEGHKSGGSEKNRPEWLKLKTRLDDPDVVAIIANDLARLHRKGWRVGQLLEWIEEHGIFLVLAAPGRELDLSNPRDRLNASFIAMLDEYYAADIAQRMRDSVAHRRDKGQTVGLPPFGTVRNDEGYLIASPQGAWQFPDGSYLAGLVGEDPPVDGAVWKSYYECAKQILERYRTNQHGIKAIAQQMNDAGWLFRSRKGKPRRILREDVRRVVANWRAYAGLVVPGRSRSMNASLIDNAPGILYDTGRSVFDLDLIRAVAEVQTARSVTTRPFGSVKVAHPYLLTGILYCAHCECAAMAEKNSALRARIGGTDKYKKLRYRHAEDARCTCKRRSLLIEEVEADFRRLVEMLTLPADKLPLLLTLAKPPVSATETGILSADPDAEKQEALTKCRRRLEAARYLYEDGDLSREEYVRRKEQLEHEIAHWEAQSTDTEKVSREMTMCIDTLGKMSQSWETASDEEKQGLARALFEAIYYDLDSQRIIDFRLKPWADSYLMARVALYDSEDSQVPDAKGKKRDSAADGHFKGWSDLSSRRALTPYPAPRLQALQYTLFLASIRV